jgi:hypothetical protein
MPSKKQERTILLIYFFFMLGCGLFLGKTLNDIFNSEWNAEHIFQSLGCDKILREDEFYFDHGHADWIKRCQSQERLPF